MQNNEMTSDFLILVKNWKLIRQLQRTVWYVYPYYCPRATNDSLIYLSYIFYTIWWKHSRVTTHFCFQDIGVL